MIMDMETVNETVEKVDQGLEEIGLGGVSDNIKEILNLKEYMAGQIPAIVGFGLKVVLAIIVFFVGRKLIRWAVKLMKRSMERARLDEGVVQFACSAGKAVLYTMLIFNIAVSLGVTESSVAALLGTAGVAIGLALQGGLANLAGGVLLLVFKPFVVGDYIIQNQQNGCEGTVARIEMCYTTLLSIDNKKIVVPNGTLSNSTIINVTAKETRKLEIKVGISYESNIQKAKEILEKILLEDPDTQGDRSEMVVFVDQLADSAVIMGLRVWVPTDSYWPVKWRLNQKIKEEFDAQGIVIPYNQMDIYVHHKDQT
jgi:small conductance mechanosensitive channel